MHFLDMLGALAPSRGDAATVARIRQAALELRSESDARLRERTAALRHDAAPDLPSRALPLVAEALRRARQVEPYGVQLQAGLALARGRLAEMATGEGKTLVALLPAFCFALQGRGVHVATVNPYLAERDAEFARGPLELLGITVALLPEQGAPELKRSAYAADVTYGVGTEFGFDYLRDQLTIRAFASAHRAPRYHEILLGREPAAPPLVQRGQAYAVIDEADSVLIDEARSPLIISTGAPRPAKTPELYLLSRRLAAEVVAAAEFAREPHTLSPALTDAGRQRAFAAAPRKLLSELRRCWSLYVETALRAQLDFRRDVHYIVAEGKVVIVDEFTGRPCPERTWRDGLHQAIEAAAGVEITEENSSEATITRPAYFRLYEKICGMTGTAREASGEMRASYAMPTSIVPLHRPSRRVCRPARVFIDRAAKVRALVREIADCHARQQPVLVGTRTIEASELLAEALLPLGCAFFLLNAKQDAGEAEIIEHAGQLGAITIATNMAGRGAHIPVPAESLAAGGLHVLGFEMNESARIDRQLIGRAARQGQPGSSQFFLALDDELPRKYAPELQARLQRLRPNADGELSPRLATHFRRMQRAVERADRASRAALAAHDRWIDELKQAL